MLGGVGSFSLVLGAVLLLVAGGIFQADRTLSKMVINEAQHDADESGLLLTSRIALKLDAIAVLRALFAEGDPTAPARFNELLASDPVLDTAALDGVERIWVVDSSGRMLHHASPGGLRSSAPDAASLTMTRSAMRSGQMRVGTIGARLEDRRVVIARPLRWGGRVVGSAGALVRPNALVIRGSHSENRLGLVVLSRGDTVAVTGDPAGEPDPVRAARLAPLPGGERWIVQVAHTRGGPIDRWAPLALALLTLSLLAVGLIRERRQAVRIAERSSELERLSSELLRANRMKSEFLANVSHELRTPLNAIVGFVELLRDGVYGELSPRQAQPVERIQASATHLRGLVDQVLDIAKMAAGRLEVHPETIVLRPFVLNVMSELESLVAEKGLSLSISVGASLPRVRTDPAHLRSILVNLVGNAIKYTSTGGIVVRARLVGAPRAAMATPVGERTLMEEASLAAAAPSRDQPWIALQVIDTGIGIASEDRERIFDEFEQVNAGPRGESMMRGTGLGLAITRRLARLLGGDVRVESEPGRGSTFTLWMPVNVSDLSTRA
jgi:signal transduction histidine kinase